MQVLHAETHACLKPPFGGPSADYDKSVFFNCPFDDDYLPLFRALIFAVFECGLIPRCAQEVYDAGRSTDREDRANHPRLPLGDP